MSLGIGLGFTEMRGVAFGPPFTLSGLFTGGIAGASFDVAESGVLFRDASGTIAVTSPAQDVAYLKDGSGNNNNATQPTLDLRGIYGEMPKTGQRNLIDISENLTLWDSGGTPLVAIDGTLGGEAAYKLTDDSAVAWEHKRLPMPLSATSPGEYTFSILLKKEVSPTSAAAFRCAVSDGASTLLCGAVINPETGINVSPFTWADAGRSFSIADSGTHWDVSVTFTIPPGFWISSATLFPAHYSADGSSGQASNTGSNTWAAPQIERGVARTAYQRAVSKYQLVEDGQVSTKYLASDLVNDSMIATLPAMGPNATVWFATQAGATILTGQSLAGSFEALRGAKTFVVGTIDRALNPSETASLSTFLAGAIPDL